MVVFSVLKVVWGCRAWWWRWSDGTCGRCGDNGSGDAVGQDGAGVSLGIMVVEVVWGVVEVVVVGVV